MVDDFPETIDVGQYTLQGMFWECAAPAKTDPAQAIQVRKFLMPPLAIAVETPTAFSQFVGRCVFHTIEQLPAFLCTIRTRRFFPLKKPSVEFNARTRTISICLYQNADMHHMVFRMIDQGFVCEPNEIVMAQLEPLYDAHGLHAYDDRVYANEE